MTGEVIEAAGGVLWRRTSEGVRVAVVHRPEYDDWTLPKGKLDPGEHPLSAARREIEEETGFEAAPGVPLGETRYRKGAAPKRVRYWSMRAVGGRFAPSAEVDRLEWLSLEAATARLDFRRDREILAVFGAAPRDTWPLVLVRHASAGKRGTWAGPDRERPLDALGRSQARDLAEVLAGYDVRALCSADVLRCIETVRPLADRLELPVDLEPALSESGYGEDPAGATRRVHELAGRGRPMVLASQRGPLPGLVERLCRQLGHEVVPLGQTPKGGYVILHFRDPEDPRIASVETCPGTTP